MVYKPKRPCKYIGCRNITANGYCDKHLHIAEQKKQARHKHYDKYKRDKVSASFYDSKAWRVTRQHAMQRDKGLCQHCLANKRIEYATLVDHIVPIKVDWSLRLTMSNLQSLCDSCHAKKTAADKIKYNGRG